MDHKEAMTAKHIARLARLPANSGHAKVLRAKLGIDDSAPVSEAHVEVAPAPAPKKKPKAKKKKKK